MRRGHLEHVYSAQVEQVDFGGSCWPAETSTTFLSRDEDPNGGLTAILRLPAGTAASPARSHPTASS
jgi:hypothetical protein